MIFKRLLHGWTKPSLWTLPIDSSTASRPSISSVPIKSMLRWIWPANSHAYGGERLVLPQVDNGSFLILQENASPGDYLREMQCMWFELGTARAHSRLKKYGEALKKCHEIDRVGWISLGNDSHDYFSPCSISKSFSMISSISILTACVRWSCVPTWTCSIWKITSKAIAISDKPPNSRFK